jgi:hypothetical protein
MQKWKNKSYWSIWYNLYTIVTTRKIFTTNIYIYIYIYIYIRINLMVKRKEGIFQFHLENTYIRIL